MTLHELGRELGGHLPPPGARVGLLGGSFNPAHDAHLEITLNALKLLDLNEVWWLVSPQNPLKSSSGMAPLADRLRSAKRVARHPRIRVTAMENLLQSRYSADTLAFLKRRFPRVRFVWLLGADNLQQLEKWERWQQIFNESDVAIFDRPSYSLKALAGKAARTFSGSRLPERSAQQLAKGKKPKWVFLHRRLNPLSATELRSKTMEGGPDWFNG
ncbi:MAG: nicotinate-nucleotide adenylyltransferase [Kiloniellales bacterium]|nr:nicotinate-nucleotide adenylyltransferase [Kiloniellales bacterium]